MAKKFALAALGAAGVAAGINAVRAAKFVPEKKDYGTAPAENVNVQRAMDNLSTAISIPTVSYPEKERVDFSQFEKFHKFLEEAYPLIHKNLTKEVVLEASLIYKWEGSRSDLDPIALLGRCSDFRRHGRRLDSSSFQRRK